MSSEPTHGYSSRSMEMYDTPNVRPSLVYCGVQREAGFTDAQTGGAGVDHLPANIHFDQRASRDLTVQHTKRIHQELLLLLAEA